MSDDQSVSQEEIVLCKFMGMNIQIDDVKVCVKTVEVNNNGSILITIP